MKNLFEQLHKKYVMNNKDYIVFKKVARKINFIDNLFGAVTITLIIILFILLFNIYYLGLWIVPILLIMFLIYRFILYYLRKDTNAFISNLYQRADEKTTLPILIIYFNSYKGSRKCLLILLIQILVNYEDYNIALSLLEYFEAKNKNEENMVIGIKIILYYFLHKEIQMNEQIEIVKEYKIEELHSALVRNLFMLALMLDDLYQNDLINISKYKIDEQYVYLKNMQKSIIKNYDKNSEH